MNAINYIQNNIDNIINILNTNYFLETGFGITTKGVIAMHIQEIHPLVFSDLYEKFNGFNELSASEIVGVLSCFTNISMPNDKRSSIPVETNINYKIKKVAAKINDLMNKYYDLESDFQLDTGSEYSIHFELIDYLVEWCNAQNEQSCISIINTIKREKELFLGEFIKAILKINNICKELEKICEIIQNLNLLQKIKEIPELTLKYVATNQSLYI